jgi:outer membrane protein TolC
MTMLKIRGLTIIAALALAALPALGQITPPIQPKVEEAPVPPAIEIPPPPSVPADVPNRPLSADEAALLALHHQPSLLTAQAGITTAQGAVQAARSALGPGLTTGAGYTHVWGALATTSAGVTGGTTPAASGPRPQASGGSGSSGSGSGTTGSGGFGPPSFGSGAVVPGYSLSATVSQLIYDFNHRRDLVHQAAALERVAQATLTQAQSDLVLMVKTAFYTYVQNQRLVGVAQANLTNQQGQLALAQARLNAGLGIPADVVTAETAVAEAVFSLTQARSNALLARITLAQQIGIDPRTPLVPAAANEAVPPAPDLSQLVSQALVRRPEIIEAQENMRAADSGLSAARTNNAPLVIGGAGWSDRDTDFPPSQNSTFVGVAASWTPFDSGFTKGLVTQARGSVQLAQAQKDTATLAVLTDVTQSYLNLKTAEQSVPSAQAAVANAQEALRLAQGRYQAGIGVFLDVLTDEAALVTAETNLVNAQTAVDQARAALAHSVNAEPVLAQAGK